MRLSFLILFDLVFNVVATGGVMDIKRNSTEYFKSEQNDQDNQIEIRIGAEHPTIATINFIEPSGIIEIMANFTGTNEHFKNIGIQPGNQFTAADEHLHGNYTQSGSDDGVTIEKNSTVLPNTRPYYCGFIDFLKILNFLSGIDYKLESINDNCANKYQNQSVIADKCLVNKVYQCSTSIRIAFDDYLEAGVSRISLSFTQFLLLTVPISFAKLISI